MLLTAGKSRAGGRALRAIHVWSPEGEALYIEIEITELWGTAVDPNRVKIDDLGALKSESGRVSGSFFGMMDLFGRFLLQEILLNECKRLARTPNPVHISVSAPQNRHF